MVRSNDRTGRKRSGLAGQGGVGRGGAGRISEIIALSFLPDFRDRVVRRH